MLSNTFSLVVLAILALVSMATASLSDFLAIDPEILLVDEKKFKVETINFSPKFMPRGDVLLTFKSSRGLTLSTCTLKFPPQASIRSTVSLQVTRGIVPAVYPPPKMNELITVTAIARDDKRINGQSLEIPVKSRSNRRGVCFSMNTPAFRSFDGLINPAKTAGWINLVKSQGFSMSVYQTPCRSNGYCIKRAVMFFSGRAVGIFDLEKNYSANQLKMIYNYRHVRVHRLRTPGFFLRTSDGISILIRHNGVNADIYVNMPASYAGKTKGICGNFDGIKENDRYYPKDIIYHTASPSKQLDTLFSDRQSSRQLYATAMNIFGSPIISIPKYSSRYMFFKQCDGRVSMFA